MNPAWIVAVVGTFLVSILVPVTLLIVFNFTPLKAKPKIAYGIPGALAALTPFIITLTIGGHATKAIIAAVLAAALFWWGYTRAAKKQAESSDPATPAS